MGRFMSNPSEWPSGVDTLARARAPESDVGAAAISGAAVAAGAAGGRAGSSVEGDTSLSAPSISKDVERRVGRA